MDNLTIITGNGKGKTTSAIGLALGAYFEGKRVYFGQFMKGSDYSEIKALKEFFPEIYIEQYSGGLILGKAPQEIDKITAQKGLEQAISAINSKKFDLVILDEINVALFLELIELADVLQMLKNTECEIILTGRYASPELLALNPNKTYEMQQIKHYFNDGVGARVGIEM